MPSDMMLLYYDEQNISTVIDFLSEPLLELDSLKLRLPDLEGLNFPPTLFVNQLVFEIKKSTLVGIKTTGIELKIIKIFVFTCSTLIEYKQKTCKKLKKFVIDNKTNCLDLLLVYVNLLTNDESLSIWEVLQSEFGELVIEIDMSRNDFLQTGNEIKNKIKRIIENGIGEKIKELQTCIVINNKLNPRLVLNLKLQLAQLFTAAKMYKNSLQTYEEIELFLQSIQMQKYKTKNTISLANDNVDIIGFKIDSVIGDLFKCVDLCEYKTRMLTSKLKTDVYLKTKKYKTYALHIINFVYSTKNIFSEQFSDKKDTSNLELETIGDVWCLLVACNCLIRLKSIKNSTHIVFLKLQLQYIVREKLYSIGVYKEFVDTNEKIKLLTKDVFKKCSSSVVYQELVNQIQNNYIKLGLTKKENFIEFIEFINNEIKIESQNNNLESKKLESLLNTLYVGKITKDKQKLKELFDNIIFNRCFCFLLSSKEPILSIDQDLANSTFSSYELASLTTYALSSQKVIKSVFDSRKGSSLSYLNVPQNLQLFFEPFFSIYEVHLLYNKYKDNYFFEIGFTNNTQIKLESHISLDLLNLNSNQTLKLETNYIFTNKEIYNTVVFKFEGFIKGTYRLDSISIKHKEFIFFKETNEVFEIDHNWYKINLSCKQIDQNLYISIINIGPQIKNAQMILKINSEIIDFNLSDHDLVGTRITSSKIEHIEKGSQIEYLKNLKRNTKIFGIMKLKDLTKDLLLTLEIKCENVKYKEQLSITPFKQIRLKYLYPIEIRNLESQKKTIRFYLKAETDNPIIILKINNLKMDKLISQFEPLSTFIDIEMISENSGEVVFEYCDISEDFLESIRNTLFYFLNNEKSLCEFEYLFSFFEKTIISKNIILHYMNNKKNYKYLFSESEKSLDKIICTRSRYLVQKFIKSLKCGEISNTDSKTGLILYKQVIKVPETIINVQTNSKPETNEIIILFEYHIFFSSKNDTVVLEIKIKEKALGNYELLIEKQTDTISATYEINSDIEKENINRDLTIKCADSDVFINMCE